jgi:carbonic anhydrase/acetyltransferase-like protein (isoleucine patch superfamily)
VLDRAASQRLQAPADSSTTSAIGASPPTRPAAPNLYGAPMGNIDRTASIAPTAVLVGDVSIGPGSRVLHGAVLNADRGRIILGKDVLIMENAVLRGRPDHPLVLGDAVLVGPHSHLNGAQIDDEVFVATGVSIFAGAVVGARSELRLNSVLHVNSTIPPDTVLPIGWIAAGSPAKLFSPDQHDALWAVQEELDFPGTMYGVPRGTSMREIMRRQSAAYGPDHELRRDSD